MRYHLFALVAVSFVPSAPARANESIASQASVIDDDTIMIHGTHIRFAGIDAPVSRQTCGDANGQAYRCGKDAAFYLSDLIGRHTVTCAVSDQDRYGRKIATCYIGKRNLNRDMVAVDEAAAYRHFSTAYIKEEDAARAARLSCSVRAAMARGQFDRLDLPIPDKVDRPAIAKFGKSHQKEIDLHPWGVDVELLERALDAFHNVGRLELKRWPARIAAG